MPGFDTQNYYQRNFFASKPAKPAIYEFVIVARNEAVSMSEILSVFSKFNVDPIKIYVDTYPEEDARLLNTFCDFSNAKTIAELFSNELRKLHSVIGVEFDGAKNRMFDRFFFPLVIGSRRGILIRMDPLLNIEKRLEKRMGSGGLAIMFDEGVSYALETMEEYKAALPGADNSTLLQNVVDGLRVTGYGLFEFKKMENSYTVSIKHPPRFTNGAVSENKFTTGIVAGIMQSLFGGKWSVLRSHYDDQEDTMILVLKSDGKIG